MKAVVQFTKAEEARSLPILLRYSAGTILPNRTYVLDEEAVAELRKSGVGFAALRIGAETSVAFRSAKGRPFRGAKRDNATVIVSPR